MPHFVYVLEIRVCDSQDIFHDSQFSSIIKRMRTSSRDITPHPLVLCLLGLVLGTPGATSHSPVSLGRTIKASEGLEAMPFIHRVVMDQRGAYVLLWTPLQDKIVMEVQVETQGYIGLGFSPNGGMKGADVVLSWVDSDNFLHFQDRLAFAHLTPSIDESQDYHLLGGYQNRSHTVVRFSRPWTTCDPNHDIQLSGDTVRVIWAYDDEDPLSLDRIPRHDYQGTRSLYLREQQTRKVAAATKASNTDVQYWDVLSHKVNLPHNLRSLYWCKLYKIPELTRKTHVIGYEPVIQPGNEQHVHHMLLYECHLPNSQKHLDMFLAAPGTQCYDRNMPYSWAACRTPIVAWAIGSEGEMYPEHTGIPLGEEHGGVTYFMLEIHYDNSNLRKGVIDNSGVRILHTSNLRQYDAGILTLGHTVSATQIIPPGKKWHTLAHCPDTCTKKALPQNGIKVFQGVLHSHLLGSSISVRQIRKGRELPVVFQDMSYDFNYQQARTLNEEMEILPGDSLIVTCGYDSTKRKGPTFGGFSTEDEMCLAFLTYYPRVNLSGCYSKPDLDLVYDTFGIQDFLKNILATFNDESFSENNINEVYVKLGLERMQNEETNIPRDVHLRDIYHYVVVRSPNKYYNRTFYDILYDDKTWQDTAMVAALQERVMFGQHETSCENHGRIIIEGLPKKTKYPDFISVQPMNEKCTSPNPDSEIQTPSKPINEENIHNDGPKTPSTWRPREENEIEQDSLELGGRGVSETIRFSTLLFNAVIMIVLTFR